MSDLISTQKVGYSTICFQYALEEDGSEVTVQAKTFVSKQAMMLKGSEGPDRVLEVVDGTIDIIEGSLALGMLFTPPPVDIACGILAGMGALVQFGLGLITGNSAVQEKLDLLTKRMEDLNKRIQEGFNDMKVFITENKFAEEIINEVSTLKKLWNDCLIVGGQATIESFQAAYEQKTPLDMIYTLKTLLDHKSTNPLKMAIDNEKDKAITFETWERIILTIIGDLKLIEAFACGLLKNKNLYDCNRIIEQETEICKNIEAWRTENKIPNIWKEMKEYMNTNLNSFTKDNKSDKSYEITQKLASYSTNDAFYVAIFDNGKWNNTYTVYCPTESRSLIGVYNNDIIVYIYQSRQANKLRQSEYDGIKKAVEACQNGKMNYIGTLENIVKDQLIKTSLIRQDAFVLLIDKGSKPEIRYVNSQKGNRGPGYYEDVVISDNNDARQTSTKTMVVGFP